VAASDTGRAAGMAAAVIAANVIALVITVVFARLLGASGYGSFAALMSAYIILMVPGSALQIAVAREVSLPDTSISAAIRPWLARLAAGTLVVAVLAVALRAPIAAAIGVGDQPWAAAAVPVTAALWMVVAVLRGSLQGLGLYRVVAISIVGEGLARLVLGLGLVAVGLDVTGAFLGTPLALVAVAAALGVVLRPRLPPAPGGSVARLRDLLAGARAPVAALTLLFVLQEVHVIVVKHEASSDAAGSYAVAAVAAKAIIWVAVGLGLYLLPEVSRRAASGIDARGVLTRTLALIAALGVPMVLVYAVAGDPLLRIVFGDDLAEASGALPLLGLAMTLLACTYLSVQYLLGLHRARFIATLAVAAVAEVVLLASIGADLEQVALALFALQAVCAAVVVTASLRTGPGEAQDPVVAEAGNGAVGGREVAVEHAYPAGATGPVGLPLGGHGAEPANHESGA
jgi:O-antigen/teichoic acid export membrane protein